MCVRGVVGDGGHAAVSGGGRLLFHDPSDRCDVLLWCRSAGSPRSRFPPAATAVAAGLHETEIPRRLRDLLETDNRTRVCLVPPTEL